MDMVAGKSARRKPRAHHCRSSFSISRSMRSSSAGKSVHQHLQAPLAVVDDPPEFGALRAAEVVVGEPDPGLHDLAAPRLRARADEFDRYATWHALSPGVPHLADTMPRCASGFRRLGGVVNGLVPAVRGAMVGAMTLAHSSLHSPGNPGLVRNDWTRDEVRALFALPFPELMFEARAHPPDAFRSDRGADLDAAVDQDRRLPGGLRLLPAGGAATTPASRPRS